MAAIAVQERQQAAQLLGALQAAQAEVGRLEGRRVALFGEFRAAVDAGDGPAMVTLRRAWEELPLLLAAAKIRLQQATLDHLGPQLPTARERRVRAEAGIEEARNKLPYARGDLPGTHQSLIDNFSRARHELEQSQAAETIITAGMARARDELARLKMIRLD